MNVMHKASRDAMKRAVRFMMMVCVGLFLVDLIGRSVLLTCFVARLFHSAVSEASCSALGLVEGAHLNERWLLMFGYDHLRYALSVVDDERL